MKFFIYKTLIVVFLVYVLFELTIGQRINKFKEQINILNSSEGRNKIISKLKEEIKDENISGGDDLDNESLENLQEKENLDNETIDESANS